MPTVTERRYWIIGCGKYIGVETEIAEDHYQLQKFALTRGMTHFELVRTVSSHVSREHTNRYWDDPTIYA